MKRDESGACYMVPVSYCICRNAFTDIILICDSIPRERIHIQLCVLRPMA